MKKYVKKILLLAFLAVSFTVQAQETTEEGLFHYVLDNGLELFVMENHEAPLAYIEIAVKAGGTAQTKETSGLFHLYEHMMFKGNTKYKTAAAVQRAMKDLGVASWNGSTSNEFINYFFTVPSSSLAEGLEFWSYAVREPLLDKNELENEKKVVISEISAYHSNPTWILQTSVSNTIFNKEPWKQDVTGSEGIITSASVEDLLEMKLTYYVPDNAALFVGGDVDPEDVLKKVKKIYGSWEKGLKLRPAHDIEQDEIEETVYLVQSHPQISPQIAQVMVYFRGPDIAFDTEATFTADAWVNLVNDPSSKFEQNLLSNQSFGIPGSDYISEGYLTSRNHSLIHFTAIVLSPEQMMGQRAAYLAQVISTDLANQIIEDYDFFPQTSFNKNMTGFSDDAVIRAQRPETYLANIRYWWAVTDTAYYFSHDKNTASVERNDIVQFVKNYLLKKPSVVVVLVNPELYESQKADYEALGYKEINADSAFWWK